LLIQKRKSEFPGMSHWLACYTFYLNFVTTLEAA
jgi:hypothetical protein